MHLALAINILANRGHGRMPAMRSAVMVSLAAILSQADIDEVMGLDDYTTLDLVHDFLDDAAVRRTLNMTKEGQMRYGSAFIKLRNIATHYASAPAPSTFPAGPIPTTRDEYTAAVTQITDWLDANTGFMGTSGSGELLATAEDFVRNTMHPNQTPDQTVNATGQTANALGQTANAPGQTAGGDQTAAASIRTIAPVRDMDQIKLIFAKLNMKDANTNAMLLEADNSDIHARMHRIQGTVFTGEPATFPVFAADVMSKLNAFHAGPIMRALLENPDLKITDIPNRDCVGGMSHFDNASMAMYGHLKTAVADLKDCKIIVADASEKQNGVMLFKAIIDKKFSPAAKRAALGEARSQRPLITLCTGDDVATFAANFVSNYRAIDKLSGYTTPEFELQQSLAAAIQSSAYEAVRTNLMLGETSIADALTQLTTMENAIRFQALNAPLVSANAASVERYPSQRTSLKSDPGTTRDTRPFTRTGKWPEETGDAWRLFCKTVGGRGKEGSPSQNALKQAWKAALSDSGTITRKNRKMMTDAEAAAKTNPAPPTTASYAVDVLPSDSSDDSDGFYDDLSNMYTQIKSKSFADAARAPARK